MLFAIQSLKNVLSEVSLYKGSLLTCVQRFADA
jgi:hypothetical protein